MKLLIINYEYPPLGGGGAIQARDLARELAKRHDVHVLTTHYRNLPREEVMEGAKVHRIPVWGRTSVPTATLRSLITFFPSACWHGFWLLKKEKFQLINAHFVIPSGLPAALLSMFFHVPFALTIIGGDIYDPSKGVSPHRNIILSKTVSWVIGKADKLTAISHDVKERAISYHNASRDIQVVPLGLVPGDIEPKSKEELALEGGKLHLVSIGRLVPRKGYIDLLKSLADCQNEEIKLHIVGDGPQMAELTKEAKQLGIKNRVVLHGHVDEHTKYGLLAGADMYVSASHHEGFGICFLEAMYMGLPIVATDSGGQTDFLAAGRNAVLVPINRPGQLAHAIDWLAQDEELREKMSATNKEDVKQYLINNTAKTYEEIFSNMVKGDE